MRQKESPELFPLKRIPIPSNCKKKWPLQEIWPQNEVQQEIVNIKEVGSSSEIM